MKKALILLAVTIMASCTKQDENLILRSDIKLETDVMTPEALWAMGRIGSYSVSPDGKQVAYQVSYYSVEEDRSNTVIYTQSLSDSTATMIGKGSDPVWLSNDKLAFASKGEVWTMNANGKARKHKFLVILGSCKQIDDLIYRIIRTYAVDRLTDRVDRIHLFLGEQQVFTTRTGLRNIDGREDTALGKLAVQYQFHVTGTFEFLVHHIIHLRAGFDQGRRKDR